MKLQKFKESNRFDLAEKIAEKFFENCGNFASEDFKQEGKFYYLLFYFPAIDEEELKAIMKCSEFIYDIYRFFLNVDVDNEIGTEDIKLNIILNKKQYHSLYEKIELENSIKKYNI